MGFALGYLFRRGGVTDIFANFAVQYASLRLRTFSRNMQSCGCERFREMRIRCCIGLRLCEANINRG